MSRGTHATTPASSARSKVTAGAIAVALVAVIAYANVYLPYYSPMAKERREMVQEEREERMMQQQKDRTPGSVWKNMGRVRDAQAAAALAAADAKKAGTQREKEEGGTKLA
jgi:hypothetical protein